jgi:hypothetical protein
MNTNNDFESLDKFNDSIKVGTRGQLSPQVCTEVLEVLPTCISVI